LSEEDEEDEKKEETCENLRFSEVKQNLDPIISFVDSNPQYNKHYLMLTEMKQDVAKEQYNRGTQTEISSIFDTGTIILCRLPKMFLRLMSKLTFLHFMTSIFIL
jgi:hypothetical protein